MPEIQTQYIEIKPNGVFASINIPGYTNIGPGFLKIRRTGDPKKDFVGTRLGININHSKSPNLLIKVSRWKYYLFSSRTILKGEELTIDYNSLPWRNFQENTYTYNLGQIKKIRGKKMEFITKDFLDEQQVKIPVEEPGKLEVPKGKNVEDLPESHFQNLIRRKGWGEISKALINLKVWNRTRNRKLSGWADNMQEKLAGWVEKERESGKKID